MTLKEERYWPPKVTSTDSRAITPRINLLQSIKQSVEKSLDSDSEIGCLLSGGIDSTAVAHFASNYLEYKLKTYSLTYDVNLRGKNEDREFAQKVAGHLGTIHSEILVTASDYAESFDDLISCLAEPFSGVGSMYFAAKQLSGSVKVLLTGDGSDEMFGSYFFHRLSSTIEKGALGTPEELDFVGLNRESFEVLSKSANEIQRRKMASKLMDYDVRSFLTKEFLEHAISHAGLDYSSYWQGCISQADVENHSALKESLAIDFFDLLPNEILYYSDRLSMRWSIEVRPPLLSKEIYEFTQSQESENLMGPLDTKTILKEVLRGVVPNYVLDRRKEGFLLPLHQWFTHDLNEWVNEKLSPDEIHKHGFFEEDKVRNLVQLLNEGDFRVSKILNRLIVFQTWWSQRSGTN
jgi:asparagine synthase (glutamine-hydrolysing)